MPLEDARAAAEHPNGPEVWDALLAELAAELREVEPVAPAGDVPDGAELDDSGAAWVPRLGGRARLGAELEQIARTGRWDRSRYAGRSEARMAILSAAVARGWRLAEVQAAASSGAWSGLAALYDRPSEPARLARLLPLEWRRAIAFTAGEKNVHGWPTSDIRPRPPADDSTSAAEYGRIRQWVTAVDCAAGDPDRVRGWGGRAIAVRLVLAAIGQAAMVSGSTVIEFGTRNLALHAAVGHRTVGRVLAQLRNEPDPLLDLVSVRKWPGPTVTSSAFLTATRLVSAGVAAGRAASRRSIRRSSCSAVRRAWCTRSSAQTSARGAEVARTARLSASAVSAALRVLAEHGLAERGPGGWHRGLVAPGRGCRVDRRGRRAARTGGPVPAGPGELAGPAQAIPGHPPQCRERRDGWWSLDDPDEYNELCRWPLIRGDTVRAPPGPADQQTRDSA